jgi:hypothetical protein
MERVGQMVATTFTACSWLPSLSAFANKRRSYKLKLEIAKIANNENPNNLYLRAPWQH